jgi:hypothetical protein
LIVQFISNLAPEQRGSVRIDWVCFYETITKWVIDFTQIPHHIVFLDGYMSQSDRHGLHLAIKAFFLQFARERASKLLLRAHEVLVSFESDMEDITDWSDLLK